MGNSGAAGEQQAAQSLAADPGISGDLLKLGLSTIASAVLITIGKLAIYQLLTDEQKLVKQGFLPVCTKTELQFTKGYSRSEDGGLIYVQDWRDVCTRKVWVRKGDTVLDNPDSIRSALQAQGH